MFSCYFPKQNFFTTKKEKKEEKEDLKPIDMKLVGILNWEHDNENATILRLNIVKMHKIFWKYGNIVLNMA